MTCNLSSFEEERPKKMVTATIEYTEHLSKYVIRDFFVWIGNYVVTNTFWEMIGRMEEE